MFSCSSTQKMQKNKQADQDSVLVWLNEKRFVFHAINAQPMYGPTINLTSDYTLELRNDSIIAWLPYFGRSFVAPSNPTDGGIKFATKNYTIKTDTIQKKIWKLMVVPKDLPAFENTKDVRQLWLNIGLNSYGSIQIVSQNRTPISFYGYVSSK